MQAKLLRVLQEKEIEPLGSEKSIPLDVRVVAATRQDLEAKMKDGSFREGFILSFKCFQYSYSCRLENEAGTVLNWLSFFLMS